MRFSLKVREKALQHAMEEAPREACGLVFKDRYVPCINVNPEPEKGFVIGNDQNAALVKKHGPYEGVMHSHTAGEVSPSEEDMKHQIASGVPWGVHVLEGGKAGHRYVDYFEFGDHLLDEPLVGRRFRMGVFDCVSLLRSWFWQEHGLKLPDIPRYDDIWEDNDLLQLFANGYSKEISDFDLLEPDDIRKGDVVMMALRSETVNHFAVLCDDQVAIHHPYGGLSSRKPFVTLQAVAHKILRYKG